MHTADNRIVRVAFARGPVRGELHKLQEGAKPGLSFSPPGAAAASATADRLRFSPANCTERTLALSVLRLRGGWCEASCTSSRTAQNLVCPFHRQVPRRHVPQLIAFASSQQAAQSGHSLCLCCVCAGARRGKLQDGTTSGCPPEVAEATARAEVICSSCDLPRSAPISVSVALRGGWGETSCTSSRKAQNLVCPFHRQVPRRQVPQLIVLASARQIAQSGHSHCPCCVCAGAGARRAAQAVGRRKVWFVLSPPGAAAASAPADRLRFSPANCTERKLALSVLRLRGGLGETSCTSSRTAQNLVCPFHRQVPRRQVPQLIVFASARQIAHSGHSHCLCCVCAGAGARRAAQAPGRHKIWFVHFAARCRGGKCHS